MPRHTLSAIVLFLSVAAIALAMQQGEESMSSHSQITKKEMLLGEVKSPILRHTSKVRGPLNAKIELLGAVPENAGDVFVLRGFVSSERELRDVAFKWSLPAGLELVNGTTAGYISILKAGEPAEVQLTLRTLASENYQVHLITGGTDKGVKFGDSTQFNTLLQGAIDQSKEELLKSTEKSAAEEKQAEALKVFH